MENWKAIPGYEGLYEVSTLGRVKRIGGWSDGRKTKPIGLLKLGSKKKRYSHVTLYKGLKGKQKSYPVHRLVMLAFIGPIPKKLEVNHKNGKKKDNRLKNLEYVTHSQNQIHSYRILKSNHFKGSGAKNAKVSEKEVIAMRSMRKIGWELKELSVKFGLSISTICWICKNKAWRHV